MNSGIIIAGNASVDILKTIGTYPAKMSLTSISSVEYSVGGAVCNCGIDLARMDSALPVTVMTAVGNDDFGRMILDRFSAHPNINTDHIIVREESSFTDVMTESDTGQRTFFSYKGADSTLVPGDFPLDDFDGQIFHIGYIMLLNGLDAADSEYGTAMARLLSCARDRGLRTSIDIVTESGTRYETLVPPALQYVDYCCINETEAEEVTRIQLRDDSGCLLVDNFQQACRKLKDLGVANWAIIHAPEHSAGVDESGKFYSLDSLDLPEGYIRGSVGAGDAFVSGVLYAALKDAGLEEALRIGTVTAVCSLSESGATEGVRNLNEMEDFVNHLFRSSQRTKSRSLSGSAE